MRMGFKGYHPIVNILFFISIVVFGMLFRHPVSLAVCFAAALIYYIRLCDRSAVRSFLMFLLPMLLFVLLINGLFARYGETPLFPLPGGGSVTLEALVYGFVLGLATVTVILWFFCYNEVVTSDKFMYVFGSVLPAAALIFCMALRFVPLYRDRLRRILSAQQGIGMDPGAGTLRQRVRNIGKVVSILITWSLENAIETSDAMRARGYGLRGRKQYSRYLWRPKDIAAVVLLSILDAVLAAGYVSKSLDCVYNPRIVICPLSAWGAVTLAAFVCLCFLPMLLDIREGLQWNRSKSKI